jgi:hypothetical protein
VPGTGSPADGLTGGCACGRVRWGLSEPPLGAAYCHCTRCQRRTGTGVSASALTAPGSFAVTAGEDALRVWAPEDGWRKFFCADCGSAVHTQHPEREEMISVRMGGFDGDPGVRPALHQFTAYAPAWAPVPDDGLPRFEERAPQTRPG